MGLIALTDPPRRSAAATIAACQAAGITLVLITGDHPATAVAAGPGNQFPPHRIADRPRGGVRDQDLLEFIQG